MTSERAGYMRPRLLSYVNPGRVMLIFKTLFCLLWCSHFEELTHSIIRLTPT